MLFKTIWWELKALYTPFMIQFISILPYWLLGLMISAFMTAFAEKAIEKAAGHLGRKRHTFLYMLPACLLGIISPLCMYGTVPLIAMLAKKGIPQGILAGFMISSILLNPTLLIMTLALGTKITIIRLVLSLFAGLGAGMLVSVFYRNKRLFFTEAFEENTSQERRTKGRQFLHSLKRNFEITAPYFLIGITLTALFQQYIPGDVFTMILGSKNPFAVLVSASLSIPLYMCGGGTIPLIQSWLDAGMSVGAACAFMISGPATKLNNLSAVKLILGKANFILYLIYTMAFSLISGYIIELFL